MTDPITAFYEANPYPARHAAQTAMHDILPSNLPVVLHYVFGGRWPRSRPFRALIAGGGTGDAVIALWNQMSRFGLTGQLTYLDVSSTSAAIARKRAQAAEVPNVEFRVGSIEDLADDGSEMFDYVDCSGVLNHVIDPEVTLARLSGVIAADGGMGMMVYGALGRTGIYPAQHALRLLGRTEPMTAGLARRFVEVLPADNWLRKNAAFGDLTEVNDTELMDILLNPRDRAFSVSDIATLFASCGLAIRTFMPPVMYDPISALRDPELRHRAQRLAEVERWHLAELIQGTLNKHVFYAVKQAQPDNTIDRLLDDPETLLVPRGVDFKTLHKEIVGSTGEKNRVGIEFMLDGRKQTMSVQFSTEELAVIGAMDSMTSVGSILGQVANEFGNEGASKALRRVLKVFQGIGCLHVVNINR